MSIFRSGNSGKLPVASIQPDFSGLAIQTATAAAPIPIIYGVTRSAPNIIWRDGVTAVPQYTVTQTGGGGGGKGGGGSGGGTTSSVSGYEYYTWIEYAVGEGPITGVGSIYSGQATYGYGAFGNLSLTPGTTPQAAWAPLAGSFPYAALSYPGTAYLASSNFDLGTSASLPSLAFEVYGRLQGSGCNAFDADPAAMIVDLLTNSQYGVAFPPASIDITTLYGTADPAGDPSYQNYCAGSGLALSPAITDQESANSILTRWLQLTNTAAIWSGGRLKLVPYGDAPMAGGGRSFAPNTTPVYDLTDDDFVYEEGVDPVQVARLDPYAVPNVQRLECFDRGNQYAATPVEARDQNAIEQFGLKIGSTLTAHEICDLGIGLAAAQLILQRGLYIRNTYGFKLSWEYCLLEPMDLVTLTDPGLGLAKTIVRITTIEEGSDGVLAVTAEEYPGSTATASSYTVPANEAKIVNRNVAPAPVNTPVIFEPPSQLTSGTPQIWAAVSGGFDGVADPNWGGANVWISRDGSSFAQVGQVTAPARQGVTTAALPAFAGGNPDQTSTLAVDLGESSGLLSSVTQTDALNAVTLSIVGDELVAYVTATLTAAYRYAVTSLQRGLYGSKSVAHAVGARFARLDGAIFKYTLPDEYVGFPLTLKFQSYNIWGGGLQDIATCTAYTYTPIGSGLFGPTADEISTGTSFDEGLASSATTQTDDYGLASDPYTDPLDDGFASDLAISLAVASGGTGATTTATARTSLGAASAGANSDITSLTNLAGVGIATTVDTTTNLFAMKSANALFDNAGAGVQMAVNKATVASSAVHLFETGYSGRAQAGLLGSDRYRVSVSATGSSYAQALDIDPATGHLGLAGYTADANNALGVLGTACLFTASSDSMRFTFNKVAPANDATLSFQTSFSARALLGTTGSDAFQLKVSPDGSVFFQVFVADQTTGNIAFKALLGTAPYAVASLPSGAFNGALAYASNGRKLGEAAGSGTGVIVAFSNGIWRRLSDDAVVTS